MKFKYITESYHDAITPEDLKNYKGDLTIVKKEGRYFVNTKEGIKEIPKKYLHELDDMYSEFKNKQKNPDYDREAEIAKNKEKRKMSFDLETTAKEIDAEVNKSKMLDSNVVVETDGVKAEDLGSIGNIGTMAHKIATSLKNMMMTRIIEIKKECSEETPQPYDYGVYNVSDGEIMLDQDNPVEVKDTELIKDESVMVKIFMDKSGSFSGNKSDFCNDLYDMFLDISHNGLYDDENDVDLLEPGQLNVSLTAFHDKSLKDIIPTGKDYEEQKFNAKTELRNVSGSMDGHGMVMDALRSSDYHKEGVLNNIMLITDNSGITNIAQEIPIEFNGILWAVFVDGGIHPGHDDFYKYAKSRGYDVILEDDVQDYLSGKYGTYIYQFSA